MTLREAISTMNRFHSDGHVSSTVLKTAIYVIDDADYVYGNLSTEEWNILRMRLESGDSDGMV